MKKLFCASCVAAFSLSLCGVKLAEAKPPVAPVLLGPDVVKLDWNIRAATAADVDGDGLNDLLVLNNDRSRIEILIQRKPGAPGKKPTRSASENRWEPELEDARFDKKFITVGVTLHDLAVGDLNGDGLLDLAYTGEPDSLTVRFQDKDGDWDTKRIFDTGKSVQWLTSMRVADINDDRRADLVVFTQKELLVYKQSAKGELEGPQRYANAEENCYSMELADIDGDGRLDLVYLAPNARDALRLRLQMVDGAFGPEMPFRIEGGKSTLQQVKRGGKLSPGFAYVQAQTGMVQVLAFSPKMVKPSADDLLKPRVFSTRAAGKNSPSYAFGDYNGDGRLDLAISDSDGAQLNVYFQQQTGDFGEMKNFPSLTEVRSIAAADWDGDGRDEIFAASAKESVVGVASYTKEGRLSYPQPLAIKGKPLTMDAGVLASGKTPSLVLVVEEGGKRRIDAVSRKEGSELSVQTLAELSGSKVEPRALRLLDANQDGLLDVVLFTPFEAARFFLQSADGTFRDCSKAPDFRKGLVENLESAQLTLAQLDRDKPLALLVGGEGFARTLTISNDGALQVADQFNARETGTDIVAALTADIDRDGQREVLLLDRKNEQIQVLRKNESGVFAYKEAANVGRIELVGARQLDFNKDGNEDLFFFGKDRFWWLALGRNQLRLESLATYETDLKDINYGDVTVADINEDGVTDFICSDPEKNLIEILVRRSDSEISGRSVLHFQVFEKDVHARSRSRAAEPREMLIADVTGDKKNDLIVVVHDRVLIYPQQ